MRIWVTMMSFTILLLCSSKLWGQSSGYLQIFTVEEPGSFPLVTEGKATPILIDDKDAEVVTIVANAVADDIAQISDLRPAVITDINDALPFLIIAGTLGESDPVNRFVEQQKVDVNALQGRWEAFTICIVEAPFAGVERALVVVGSDRRGTAYGLFELSRMLGVSPWVWWADVKPEPRKELFLQSGVYNSKSPSVKYRGIFLNDEDWGLHPWAALNLDKDIQDIGPRTHARIFELMLRLRANIIWPAMHDSTRPFWMYPENAEVADRYAIVIGSTHCDMMHRSNTYEWQVNFEKEYGVVPDGYRYDTNREQVHRYWEDRVAQAAKFENMYTIGMRGIRDGSMNGPSTTKEKIELLDIVIDDQRKMIEKYHGAADAAPQLFIPYKEVLSLYNAGLQIPEDVTLVWTDDNYGYIRRLSTPDEQDRKGRSGIYYHLSYMGKPHDYLWLSSISPALISYEMTKAYQFGADQFWIVNAGDIKPGELEVEFFLDLAWDNEQWNPTKVQHYTKVWAERNFGKAFSDEIAKLKDEYYRLTQMAKPEHTRLVVFDKQARAERLEAFDLLEKKTVTLAKQIPDHLQSAYFQLITYPVQAASQMVKKHAYAQMSFEVDERQYGLARRYAQEAKDAYDTIKELSAYYNRIENGKWRGMITDVPRDIAVYGMPDVAIKDVLDKPVRDLSDYDRRYSDTTRVYVPYTNREFVISAADFSEKRSTPDEDIIVINGLGLDGKGISRYPFTGQSFSVEEYLKAPVLTYVTTIDSGEFTLSIKSLPTRAIHRGRSLKAAVVIGDNPVQFVDFHEGREGKVWSANVLKGYTEQQIDFSMQRKDDCMIKIYLLDTGLVLNRLEILNN